MLLWTIIYSHVMLHLLQEAILRSQRFQVYNLSAQMHGALPVALTCDYIFCHRLARDAAFAMALVAASVLGRFCQCCVLQSRVVIFKHITPTLRVHQSDRQLTLPAALTQFCTTLRFRILSFAVSFVLCSFSSGQFSIDQLLL